MFYSKSLNEDIDHIQKRIEILWPEEEQDESIKDLFLDIAWVLFNMNNPMPHQVAEDYFIKVKASQEYIEDLNSQMLTRGLEFKIEKVSSKDSE